MTEGYVTHSLSIQKNKKLKKYATKLTYIIISLILLIVIWWALAAVFDKSYFPTPDIVFEAFVQSFDSIPGMMGMSMTTMIFSSLQRFALGFVLAMCVAIPLGLIMGYCPRLNMLVSPALEVFRPIPPMAWVPLFFLAFGALFGPVLTIFMGAFFPILSNVVFGVKNVDNTLIDASKTLGANSFTIFRKVVFPSTIPHMMTGVSVGLGIGWMCIVSAEMIGARGGGLGYLIQTCFNMGMYEYMFAGMVMVGILGIATALFGRFIEKEVSIWMGMK